MTTASRKCPQPRPWIAPAWLLAALMAAPAAVGCAHTAHPQGLIQVEGRRVLLIEPQGQRWRLTLSPEAQPLAELEGCMAELEGQALGARLRVTGWRITDAGGGSAPYVGVLQRLGIQWALVDPQTGHTMILQPESTQGMESVVGQLLLVEGFVVSSRELRVVRYKPLGPPVQPW